MNQNHLTEGYQVVMEWPLSLPRSNRPTLALAVARLPAVKTVSFYFHPRRR
jgi:hypothetical protein